MGEAAPRRRALPAPGHQLLSGYNCGNSALLLLAGPRDRKSRQGKPQSRVVLLRGELGIGVGVMQGCSALPECQHSAFTRASPEHHIPVPARLSRSRVQPPPLTVRAGRGEWTHVHPVKALVTSVLPAGSLLWHTALTPSPDTAAEASARPGFSPGRSCVREPSEELQKSISRALSGQ